MAPEVLVCPDKKRPEENKGRASLAYSAQARARYGADPVHIKEAAALLVNAKRPVIYAGQGVHYAKAWPQLKRLAERLAIPVTTSLGGKSSFPETHPLSLGSGGLAVPRAVPPLMTSPGTNEKSFDRYSSTSPKLKIMSFELNCWRSTHQGSTLPSRHKSLA